MSARIVLSQGSPPSDQIREQLRGLVSTGILTAGERLPSVRQLASDLRVAPGTVAKAYKSLEEEGLLITRVGAGTRVSAEIHQTSANVLTAARHFASLSTAAGVTQEEALNILSAVWRETE